MVRWPGALADEVAVRQVFASNGFHPACVVRELGSILNPSVPKLILKFLLPGLLLPAIAPAVAAAKPVTPDNVRFNRDVRPILSENCFQCHGADANKRKAKLRLDVREVAVDKGAFVPGKPEESELIKRIFSTVADEQMPPPDSNRHLNARQKEILRAWIKGGAKYEPHWAFIAPTKSELPAVKRTQWSRNPIDAFVLARLETEKLSPSPEAPVEKLLRRVSLDLTGLPPTSAQMKTWKQAKDPYLAAVDESLASPHFGERMAADWLDVARYADTHGFNNDSARSMWRWRDWAIEAFNRNLPYDRFITEQLAGDLLEKPTLDQRLATGFNRNHVINSEGGIIDEEYRVEYVIDRVQTTSLAWLGLTTGCARCHDHKFDPVTQKDFYRLFAFFNNLDEHGEDGRVANASPLMPSPTAPQQAQMAEQQRALAAAEKKMKRLLEAQDWSGVKLAEAFSASTNANPLSGTNRFVAFDLTSWSSTNSAISNLAGGKPFQIRGAVTTTNGPGETIALSLNGSGSLKTDALPKADTGGGWSFAAWVRRDDAAEAALFSTANFNVPMSSGSYGQGVEIRLARSGAVEVRVTVRWPAYSLAVVTREFIAPHEWRHVLVTSDGTTKAKGVRVFLDGRECFRDVTHDDLTSGTGISGAASLGATGEKDVSSFRGALADVTLLAKPVEPDKLSGWARGEARQVAAKTPVEARDAKQTGLLRAAWLRKNNPEFAGAMKGFNSARVALLALERDAPTTMVMSELPQPRASFVLFRGQYDQPRDKVEPGVPEFLLPFSASAPRNRLGLAQWLTDPRQPLTARVVVNRFWAGFFGTGIVKSVEDLGFQSDWPSHPELLDWLAVEFRESGWDVKKLVKLIVTSATYRQDSGSTAALNERDPENCQLARGPRQRLTAEMLRDQALALSGLLGDGIGGPPVYPYQPTNLYKGIVVAADYPSTTWTDSKGNDLYRRSLYTFWKRTVPHPTLATFDAPDREVCVARRLKTNTPLQALALMNDVIQLEAARKLAERMLTEGGAKPEARLDFAFELATARRPKAAERKVLASLLEHRLSHYRGDVAAAKSFLSVGSSEPDAKLDAAELAAYANVASLILNLDETITRN
ncbi:MAG: DUF1553 domain-containing protein [Pedosphaera sp.]|nr:DUF1553 domain-containing protein [Pedosphaera sp.]